MTLEGTTLVGKHFPDQPDIKPIVCADTWVHRQCYQLREDYTFIGPTGQPHTIPDGFMYDGASIPRAVWTITGITPDGLHRAATLIHDYLYLNRERYDYTRRQVDELFRDQMLTLGMPRAKTRKMYRAVRLLGWSASPKLRWPRG
jgi:hypothetical protein